MNDAKNTITKWFDENPKPKLDELNLFLKKLSTLYPKQYARHQMTELLLFVLNKNKAFLISHGDYPPNETECLALKNALFALAEGVPLAYVIGRQGFWGREFVVNEHTLIPRPDTEILAQVVMDFAKEMQILPNHPSILDLGTGSGCIAITLSKELRDWQVLAVDVNPDTLVVARQNGELHGAENCQFLQSNWFDGIDKNKFTIIVSNPPYIDKNDQHLASLKAEPIGALVAEDTGLADIKKIAHQAKDFLQKGGLIALEHGYNQGADVRRILTENGYQDVQTVQDFGCNDRVTFAIF